jgi:hypothetical protein
MTRPDLAELERPVRQSRFGDPDGNCFEACIATITGIPLEDIPHFLSDDWYAEYRVWLRAKGWNLIWWDAGAGAEPPGIAIASGTSERGLPHSVVYRDGVLTHDPHPSDAGLSELQYWLLLWPCKDAGLLAYIQDLERALESFICAAHRRDPKDTRHSAAYGYSSDTCKAALAALGSSGGTPE